MNSFLKQVFFFLSLYAKTKKKITLSMSAAMTVRKCNVECMHDCIVNQLAEFLFLIIFFYIFVFIHSIFIFSLKLVTRVCAAHTANIFPVCAHTYIELLATIQNVKLQVCARTTNILAVCIAQTLWVYGSITVKCPALSTYLIQSISQIHIYTYYWWWPIW